MKTEKDNYYCIHCKHRHYEGSKFFQKHIYFLKYMERYEIVFDTDTDDESKKIFDFMIKFFNHNHQYKTNNITKNAMLVGWGKYRGEDKVMK